MFTFVALTWFTWIAANGVPAYTDDRKHIPDAYRDEAREFTPESIWDYSKMTILTPAEAP